MWCDIVEAEIHATDQSAQGNRSTRQVVRLSKYLDTKSRTDIPLRNMKIVHDWSGFYYDGTVYTDAEEEEMIRKQFNIPKSA